MAYSPADLKMVDDHIAQGERHIIQQEELVTRLGERGLPTEAAEKLLSDFREMLQQHWNHRELIARDLEAPRPPLP